MDIDKLVNTIGSVVSTAVEDKKNSLEREARKKYKEKFRTASDDVLYRALSVAEEKGNYIMVDVIQDEMNRRDLY